MNILNCCRFLDRTFCGTSAQILMYHGFTDGASAVHADNPYGTHLNISAFAQQIAYLKDHYSVISLAQWVDFCGGRGSIPRQPVVLTFDDGYESNYLLAMPVLKKFSVPATVFVTTDFIEGAMFFPSNRIEYSIRHTRTPSLDTAIMGVPLRFSLKTAHDREHAIRFVWQTFRKLSHANRLLAIKTLEDVLELRLTSQNAPPFFRPLQWAQCREMIHSGLVTIGGHTCSHPSLASCSVPMMEEEILLSRSRIEKNTGSRCDLFCYPYGGPDDFNETTRQLLIKHQFKAAVTTLSGSNHRQTDPYELRRLGTSNEHSLDDFKRLLLQSYRVLRREYKQAYRTYTRTKTALGIARP